MLQPYDPCPCGSGEKLKFCCRGFYAEVQKAEELFDQGQHEAAMHQIDTVIAAHPDKVAPLGKKAQFLAQLGKLEAADEALEKAFAVKKDYGPGLLMRAQLRLHEGELNGALLLARRACEAYPPESVESLALLYHMIFDGEMTLQHTIAAHVALSLARRFAPNVEQLEQFAVAYFGDESPLPMAARKIYNLRSPAANDAARRARWESELGRIAAPHLLSLARLCEEIATADEMDSAAWFNFGLARAWAGNAAGALEALEKSLAHETDDALAREAAGLGEALRLGVGMETQCDYVQHGFGFDIPDAPAVSALLKEWHGEGRLLVQPSEERQVISALVLDLQKGIVVSESAAKATHGTFAAYLHIEGTRLRMRGPDRESIERLRDVLRQRLGLPVSAAEINTSTRPFHDLILPALQFPSGNSTEFGAEKVRESARKYFEERWIRLPLKSLGGNSPADAVGSSVLKRKLAGVVDFVADCCTGAYLSTADFNRLRTKLGLESVAVDEPTPEPMPAPAVETRLGSLTDVASAALNIPEMNPESLAGLDIATLAVPLLEQAYQTAFNLKADEQTTRFAKELIGQPAEKEKNDRFKFFSFLILKSLAASEFDPALSLSEAGLKFDADHNAGARRDDYDLRRGQVLARKGDNDAASTVFGDLLERSPDNTKLRVEVVETLLRLKKGKLALKFAEAGIERAKEKYDYESEGHFQDLASSARKMSG